MTATFLYTDAGRNQRATWKLHLPVLTYFDLVRFDPEARKLWGRIAHHTEMKEHL